MSVLEQEMAAPGVMSGVDRLDRIVTGAAEQAAHMAWWLALVAEYDRRRLWEIEGARSCADLLAWRCGIDPRTARMVRLPLAFAA